MIANENNTVSAISDYPLLFRHLVPHDVPAITVLSDELFPNMYTADYYDFTTTDTDKFFTLGCFSPRGLLGFVIVLIDQDFVRSCSSRTEKELAALLDDKVACVLTFGVEKKSHRRQIGSFLMAQSIHYLVKNTDICALYLNVNVSNMAAMNFYRKHGYQFYHCVKNYYSNATGGYATRDSWLMFRRIRSLTDQNANCG